MSRVAMSIGFSSRTLNALRPVSTSDSPRTLTPLTGLIRMTLSPMAMSKIRSRQVPTAGAGS